EPVPPDPEDRHGHEDRDRERGRRRKRAGRRDVAGQDAEHVRDEDEQKERADEREHRLRTLPVQHSTNLVENQRHDRLEKILPAGQGSVRSEPPRQRPRADDEQGHHRPRPHEGRVHGDGPPPPVDQLVRRDLHRASPYLTPLRSALRSAAASSRRSGLPTARIRIVRPARKPATAATSASSCPPETTTIPPAAAAPRITKLPATSIAGCRADGN